MLLLAIVGAPARAAVSTSSDRTALRSLVETHAGCAEVAGAGNALPQAYRDNDFEHLWHNNSRPTGQATELLQVLDAAEAYGFQSDLYASQSAPLRAYAAEPRSDPRGQAEADIALSCAAMRLVVHLHQGRIEPSKAGFDLPRERPPVDLAQALHRLSKSSDLRAVLASYEPDSTHYRLLKQQLATYRTLASRPTLTHLPPLPKRSVSEGDMYEGADRLRALLSALGDLHAADPDRGTAADVLDASLILAVKRFQQRHGLTPDGILGRKTYAALTTPLAQRVRQIELTMERWRWLPPLEPPLVVVNIPQFMVFGLPTGNHAAAVESPVIVGTLQNRTPVFASSIQSVIFRPFWDIPYSISTREILPIARRKPDYLARNHMELVRGQSDNAAVVEPTPENLERVVTGELRLRQRPGADNALGLIKFLLPNAYDVYLHDTPAAALFAEERRAFSHGCIRVGKPAELAYYVLQHAGAPWTRDAIETAMCGMETLRVKLPKPVPVMVLYGTAVASATRGMLFFEDLYGLDRRLETLLGLRRVR